METIEKSIEVEAPIGRVYNQWTQFEDFPRFMEGVEQVKQLDDKHLHWTAKVAGRRKEWDAEIVEQVPEDRIAWRSITGSPNSGVVHFHPSDSQHTVITLRLNYEPEGAMENIGSALGLLSGRIENDLKHFKDFIQQRGTETGSWRGEIHRGEVKDDGSTGTM
ncbi:MAG TPA: SRPBCC family protein [Candidatus Paceibacterota bacterium]|nr:SRPBCC family protein [Candidatus Paceibacterota bacterium]